VAIDVKICGIDRNASIDAAVENGAAYLGFVFYPPSPRNLTIEKATQLINHVPKNIKTVGLFVDPTNLEVEAVLKNTSLDFIQLHGLETPNRVTEIKNLSNLPILKAIQLADQNDLKSAREYFDVADRLLFDAKAPMNLENALPGGNAISFDWGILKDTKIPVPWMLAGGLIAENISEAVKESGTSTIDVSSGVEDIPGRKNLSLIKDFLTAAKAV